MSATALVPAFDEAATVADTVRAVISTPGVRHVLVVDDGSSDETAAEAERAGAAVLRMGSNRGKGAAVEAGLDLVEDDIVLLLDADLGDTACQAAALLEPVAAGMADMTVARFPPPPDKAGFGLVKGLARWGIRTLGGGFVAHAPLSGQRALTRRAVQAVRPLGERYGLEVALTVRALRAGLRVVEVPTTMSHAATGRDLRGFVHRGRQFVDVTRTLARLASERRPQSP